MLWVGTWVLLVLVAALVLGGLAWTVFRKGVATMSELGAAAGRASAIAAQVERIGGPRQPEELAVFADARELRRERLRRMRTSRRIRARKRGRHA